MNAKTESPIDKACRISREYGCAQYVNAKVERLHADGKTADVHLYVSDWYDADSTVMTFCHGSKVDDLRMARFDPTDLRGLPLAIVNQ